MAATLKHAFHVVSMYSFIILIEYITLHRSIVSNESASANQIHPASYSETILTLIFMTLQLLVLLPVPQLICNVLGLTFFNAFKRNIKLNKDKTANDILAVDDNYDNFGNLENRLIPNDNKDNIRDDVEKFDPSTVTPAENSTLLMTDRPHVCFRVVTRGLYPGLVCRNLRRNLLTCASSNLNDYSFEIVTDKDLKPLTAISCPRVRQIVVPSDYRSSTGAMFKARALQYALEPGTSPIIEGDYIVHLDEETLLTNNSINGILNFTSNKQHSFGQGLIVYMNDEVVNWITTMADCFRVAEDMGKLRFSLSVLHKPIFSWKGSYVVTRYEAERDVSFDNGPDGSIAEDCYFSMVALSKGYSFDFIEGEMLEKSPFTILDALRQRKRWIQGMWLVVHSPKIPIRVKFFLAISCYAWASLPLCTMSYVLTTIFTLPNPLWINLIGTFCFSVSLYLYIFGLIKSFDLRSSMSKVMLLVLVIGQIMTIFLNIVIENIAVVWGMTTPKHHFYIVAKDTNSNVVLDV